MESRHLLLLLWTMSMLCIKGAADKRPISGNIQIKLCEHFISSTSGTYTFEIPRSAIEPITSKTFAQRTEETVKKGIPLVVTHIMQASNIGFSATTVDTCALVRANTHNTESLLPPDTTMIDGKDITGHIDRAITAYINNAPHTGDISSQHSVHSTVVIGPFYRDMGLKRYAKLRCSVPNTKPLLLQNVTLVHIALLYEFTKDIRMLHVLSSLYEHGAQCAALSHSKDDMLKALKKILKTIERKKT